MADDPKLTHMNRRLVQVDDFATDGRPDTMKILPDLQRKLKEAQAAQREEYTLERDSFLKWLKGKIEQYQTRARARQK